MLETLITSEDRTDPMAELLAIERYLDAAETVKHLGCMPVLVNLLTELGGSHYLRELLLMAKRIELEARVLAANVHDFRSSPAYNVRMDVGVIGQSQDLNPITNLVGDVLAISGLYLCADVHAVHCHLAFAAAL